MKSDRSSTWRAVVVAGSLLGMICGGVSRATANDLRSGRGPAGPPIRFPAGPPPRNPAGPPPVNAVGPGPFNATGPPPVNAVGPPPLNPTGPPPLNAGGAQPSFFVSGPGIGNQVVRGSFFCRVHNRGFADQGRFLEHLQQMDGVAPDQAAAFTSENGGVTSFPAE